MSDEFNDEQRDAAQRADPRTRPPDPAGTRPRFDPESLLPSTPDPLLPPLAHGGAPAIDVDGVEVDPDDLDRADFRTGGGDLLPERHTPAGAPVPASAGTAPPHAARLQFALGALIAVGIAGIALLVAVITRPADTNGPVGPTWSAWKPATDGVDGATQIADHVGREYRFPSGRQLVGVQASKMQFEGVPLDVAVREAPDNGGNIRIFTDGGLIYRFCGFGTNCSINRGKPSKERHLLLRREALELALYSFRYLGVKSVVVFMPPLPGEKPSQALFFRQGDVETELNRPLTATLASRVPSVRTVTISPDAQLVNTITLPKLFDYSLTAANTANRGFIVLDPPGTNKASTNSNSSTNSSSSGGSGSPGAGTSTGKSSSSGG